MTKMIETTDLNDAEVDLVVGGKDRDAGTVSVRRHGVGDQGAVPFDEFRAMLRKEIEDRALPPVPESVE